MGTYVKLKKEDYMCLNIKSAGLRQAMTKLSISAHRLSIETGKHT